MITTDQTKILSAADKLTSQKEKEILRLYEDAEDTFNKKLAYLKEQAEKGLLEPGQKLRINRIESFLADIKSDIETLKKRQYEIITNGYLEQYENTYYATGFVVSKDVNNRVLSGEDFDYSLGYRKLNLPYIYLSYDSEIASMVLGGTIKQRTQAEIIALQSEIRKYVTSAVARGLSPADLARELQGLDDVFASNYNNAIRVARTELLRAYSLANEDAIETAEYAGVSGQKIWDATLDGFTRPDHAEMDQKAAENDGFFTLPNGDRAKGPRMPGLSAGQSINCRCGFYFLPSGVTPNSRGARLADGTWKRVGALNYKEWAKTLDGKLSIEKTEEYKRIRAKELSTAKAEGKPAKILPPVKKRLEMVS